MTESLVSKANREKLEAEKWFYYMEAVREGVNLAIEQGLWIAIMVDMAAISGDVPEKDENDKETFLWGQRYHIIKSLDFITKDKIDMLVNIPNPLMYLFRFMKPLKDELEKEIYIDGKKYYRALDPIPRMICIFVLPGILKLIASQIGEIFPG